LKHNLLHSYAKTVAYWKKINPSYVFTENTQTHSYISRTHRLAYIS